VQYSFVGTVPLVHHLLDPILDLVRLIGTVSGGVKQFSMINLGP